MPGRNISLPDGYRLAFCEHLDSTNSEALRRAGDGEGQGLWIWALMQGSGRGRHGRHWDSFPGNLFASLLLRPACTPMVAAQLGFVGGLGMFDAVKELAGASTIPGMALKWPNDLLCGGRKAGGILLESSAGEQDGLSVVMGFGLNLVAHPVDADFPATDLAQIGIEATPAETLKRLAGACARWLSVWRDGGGFGDIRKAWIERSLPSDTPLEIKLADERLRGAFRGIDEDGALIIAEAGGDERRITTGDISPL